MRNEAIATRRASNAQNTGATPLRPPRLDLGEDSDVSDDESDGEYNPSTPPASSARKSPPRTATKSPPPREDAPSVVHNLSFAAPRVVPPPVAHGERAAPSLRRLTIRVGKRVARTHTRGEREVR